VIRRRALLAGGATGLLALAGPFLPAYPLTLVTQALIVAVLAMSLDVLLGYTGMPSLGHAAYWGVGAYAVALLATERGVGLAGCLAAGVLLAGATAAVFGLVAIRAAGTYFLMITLALGMVVWGLANRWVSLTKGDNGISPILRPDLGLPWSMKSALPFYFLVLIGFVLALSVLRVVVRSPFGRTLVGIRESESRMRTLGYNVWLHKYIAFIIGGATGGFAGVLWAYYDGFVGPTDLDLTLSIETLLMVALGGRGRLLGATVGAAMIVILKNLVSVYTQRWLIILGLVYIATIRWAPEGVLGALAQWTRRWRKDGVEWQTATPRP
jgi:branched-chain amino acid transport system permease protein